MAGGDLVGLPAVLKPASGSARLKTTVDQGIVIQEDPRGLQVTVGIFRGVGERHDRVVGEIDDPLRAGMAPVRDVQVHLGECGAGIANQVVRGVGRAGVLCGHDLEAPRRERLQDPFPVWIGGCVAEEEDVDRALLQRRNFRDGRVKAIPQIMGAIRQRLIKRDILAKQAEYACCVVYEAPEFLVRLIWPRLSQVGKTVE